MLEILPPDLDDVYNKVTRLVADDCGLTYIEKEELLFEIKELIAL